MTTVGKSAETEKEESKFGNIKRLNALKSQGTLSALINNFKDARRRLDGILNDFRERERAAERARKEELQKKAEAAAPVKQPLPVPPQPEPVQAPAQAPEKPVQEERKPDKKAEPPKPAVTVVEKPTIRTRQFDATPSYIRGVMKPTPPRPPQSIARPNDRRPAAGARPPLSRPGMGTGAKRPVLPRPDFTPPPAGNSRKPFDNKKKDYGKSGDDKKSMTKRTLIRRGFVIEDFDEERMGTRKLKNRKQKEQQQFVPGKIEKAVITTENLTVKILSEKIGKTAQEIIKQLMILGIMTNINSVVDFPTMELVANELGVELELKLEQTKEEQLEAVHEEQDDEKDLVKRPPIITVMGHVDHGKTSLLDAIRKTSVASGEAGGITQHIGAYSVSCKGEKITFLDTPGHEAFTEMRARGARITDIAILVVAADDGIMPQTVEAIHHAKAAKVPIIVAVNKIDKPGANVEKIKQALTEHDLVPEDWGGDTMVVPISAKTGEGIDKLLETVLFLAEYNNYRANPNRSAKAAIVEARLDKGKGPIANVIVQNGTLHVGDYVVSGCVSGKVRAMVDDKGRSVKSATPGTPVSVLGFAEVPNAGESMFVVSDEKMARQVVAERVAKIKNEQANQGTKVTWDDMLNKMGESEKKELNVIIKADVQGSVEAIRGSLLKLANEEVRLTVVHGGVGAINQSDVMLAEVSNAIIIGFNVRPDSEARNTAEQNGVDIRLYSVIYECIDDIERAVLGLGAPKYNEVILGRAQVRNVFKITGVGAVAGSYVLSGKIVRGAKVRVYRDGAVVCEGAIDNLKRFKEDVKEVGIEHECGIHIDNYTDIRENDEIEAYNLETVK